MLALHLFLSTLSLRRSARLWLGNMVETLVCASNMPVCDNNAVIAETEISGRFWAVCRMSGDIRKNCSDIAAGGVTLTAKGKKFKIARATEQGSVREGS